MMDNEIKNDQNKMLQDSIALARIENSSSDGTNSQIIVNEIENLEDKLNNNENNPTKVKKSGLLKKIFKALLVVIFLAIIVIGIDTGQAIILNNDPFIGIQTKCNSKAGLIVETYHCGNKKHAKLNVSSCSFKDVCGHTVEKVDLKSTIKTNFDEILKENAVFKIDYYTYKVESEYYDNIISLGAEAIPVLLEMYENDELNADEERIAENAIQEISNCNLKEKFNIFSQISFLEIWNQYNCKISTDIPNFGVTLTLEEWDKAKNKGTFILKNNTDQEFWYGTQYLIEFYDNGKWSPVEGWEKKTWVDEASNLEAFKDVRLTINWYSENNPKEGRYRIGKVIFTKNVTADFYVYGEFTLK